MLFGAFYFLQAQQTRTYTAGHYTFTYPESFTKIETVAESFNGYWSAFNEVFRFNPETESNINHVVIFADKASFDSYISNILGEPRNYFIFLKYPSPELSELVLFLDEKTSSSPVIFSGPALNRQLFLQYLYSFVSEPPIWIRNGFQAYFENIEYNPELRKVNSTNYSAWLETAKNLRADSIRRLSTTAILNATTGSYEEAQMYPQSWSLVSFMIHTEISEYQRFLCEAFIILEGNGVYNTKSQLENTELIQKRFTLFNSATKCDEDITLWLSHQYTYAELLQLGVLQYNEGKYVNSFETLQKALHIRPDDPLLAYYMGLVLYSEKEYKTAESWYKKALEYGAEISTVHWALGLNSYADKRYGESRTFLETAKSVNPARYTEKVDTLIKSMPK